MMSELIEQLAAIEHERWADWQRYLHSKCSWGPNGGLTIPTELVARWERQIDTPYAGLSEQEKESDREQVWRYLPIIEEELQAQYDAGYTEGFYDGYAFFPDLGHGKVEE